MKRISKLYQVDPPETKEEEQEQVEGTEEVTTPPEGSGDGSEAGEGTEAE